MAEIDQQVTRRDHSAGVGHTPGPWEYVPGTEHHGPYITSEFGSTIADFYTMSKPGEMSVLNGGPSKPLPFLYEMAEPNALLASTAPELREAVVRLLRHIELLQRQCRQYVEPSGYTSFDRKRIAFEADIEAKDRLFTSDMIYLLDGPEQREAQEFARAALAKAGAL